MTATIWMFGGQGSQYYAMGRDLYAGDPVFERALDACSEILGPLLGASLSEILYRERPDRFAPFDRLLHSNPAICAVQYSVAEALKARGCRPDHVLGYSLGSISAEIVAGALQLEDGLRIAVRLAELTEERLPAGGMLAVLAAPETFPDTWTAARNFATHFVVAGETVAVDRAESELLARRIAVQRLPVRHAFHCPLIDPIEPDFTRFVAARSSGAPSIPVIARRSAWDAVRQPVDFKAIIDDVESHGSYRYVDVGPSGTLATFVKYNLRAGSSSEIISTVTPFDRGLQAIAQLEAAVPAREQA